MLRIWTVLLLIGCATVSGRASAQALQQRCKPERISAQIAATHQIPRLRGCRVEDADAGLGMQDYSLKVEGRHDSESIGEGRIVSQREVSDSSYVYVVVSTGPSHHQQPAGGQYGEGGGGGGHGVGQAIVETFIGALANHPPANPPPPAYEPPPPPAYEPPPVYQSPQPPPEQAAPPLVQPVTPPPQPAQPAPQAAPPVVAVNPPKPATIPAAGKPADTVKPQLAQVDKTPPPKDDAVTSVTQNEAPPAATPAEAEPDPTLFDPGLIDGPSATPTPAKDPTPISNTSTSTQKPVPPVVDHRTWWQKLLDDIASSPALIAALAAAAVAAAAAGVAKFLVPRATCSIGTPSVSLGAVSPRSRWPSLSVETVLGDPSFAIARPMPMGRRTDAPEPSPA